MAAPNCSALLIVKVRSPRPPAKLVGRTVTPGAIFAGRRQSWACPSYQPSPGKVQREEPSSLTLRGRLLRAAVRADSAGGNSDSGASTRVWRRSSVGAVGADILIVVREIEGCSGTPLQATGWSGRHPRGRETRRIRLGRPGLWTARTSCVCRPDVTTRSRYGTPRSRSDDWRGSSPRGARRRFHSTSRLIAGTSRLHDTLLQLGGRFVGRPGCAPEAALQPPESRNHG